MTTTPTSQVSTTQLLQLLDTTLCELAARGFSLEGIEELRSASGKRPMEFTFDLVTLARSVIHVSRAVPSLTAVRYELALRVTALELGYQVRSGLPGRESLRA